MAKVDIQKIVLKTLKAGIEPWANKKYSHTWLLGKIVDQIEEELIEKPARWYKYSADRAYKKLLNEGLIRLDTSGKPLLTKNGELMLSRLETAETILSSGKKWDGKFRLIIFDISEQKKSSRAKLRSQLVRWGFIRLQNSVWVTPYDCKEIIAILKTQFGVSDDVLYITAESIENDGWIRKQFGV